MAGPKGQPYACLWHLWLARRASHNTRLISRPKAELVYMNCTKKNIWTYVFLDYFQSIWSILSEKNIHTQIYSFSFVLLPITYQRFEKHKINIFVTFPSFSMIICLFYMVLEICCSNSIQQFRYFCQNVSFMAQNL